ncbi:MAG: gluconolaconase [Bacteroidetes bacterium]|nr:gluconolaconase [Bacteroidota bacterium]
MKAILLILVFCNSYYSSLPQSRIANLPIFEQLWVSEKSFKCPESVIYDEVNNVVYISNINGDPSEKDGNGFISRLNPCGTIEKLKWITGLNAPKGMGLYQNKLYVADINEVIEISVNEGKVVRRYKANTASFLNDVAISENGDIYISDTKNNVVFCLKNGKMEQWLSSGQLNSPNGLLAEKGFLLIGCDGYLIKAEYTNKKISRFITDTDYIDGIVSIDKGFYLVSDFLGVVNLVHPDIKRAMIIDLSSKGMMAADIDLIKKDNILLIPTFEDNRVVAYKVKIP